MEKLREIRLQKFLARFKRDLQAKRVLIAARPENDKCLEELQVTRQQALDALQQLDTRHCNKGPCADDRGRPMEWWFFGPVFQETRAVYVKISEPRDTAAPTYILSFHWPEYPMPAPLFGSKESLKLRLPESQIVECHETDKGNEKHE